MPRSPRAAFRSSTVRTSSRGCRTTSCGCASFAIRTATRSRSCASGDPRRERARLARGARRAVDRRLADEGEELPENALGQSPHRVLAVLKDGDLAQRAANGHGADPPRRLLAQRRHRHPERRRYLATRYDLDARAHERDVRTDDDGREHRRARTDVVEVTEQPAVARDVDSGLLQRLAYGRHGEIVITRLHATARACDVAAPRIALGLGPLDHEEL